MAYAAARFADSCLRAMSGEGPVHEYAYVASSLVPGLPYFASGVALGRGGVERVLPLGPLDEAERAGLEGMRGELLGSINKGLDFVRKGPAGGK